MIRVQATLADVLPNGVVMRLVFLCILVACSITISGCRSVPRPEVTVRSFVRAFNEKDFNVLLTCIDPKQERLFRASFRLVEKFTGGRLPVDEVLELIPGMYQMLQSQMPEDLNFEDARFGGSRVHGGEAVVPVSLMVVAKSRGVNETHPQELAFLLHRFDEGWRIVGIQHK